MKQKLENVFSSSASLVILPVSDNVISSVLVAFVKQIVGAFYFSNISPDGLALWHRLHFVTDEQIILTLGKANKYRLCTRLTE